MTNATARTIPGVGHGAPVNQLDPGGVSALEHDLDTGAWVPGPLERSLTQRLLLACAGDGLPERSHLLTTLWEGSVELTRMGEGRLAQLLTRMLVATEPEWLAEQSAALRLLCRVADEDYAPVDVPH